MCLIFHYPPLSAMARQVHVLYHATTDHGKVNTQNKITGFRMS